MSITLIIISAFLDQNGFSMSCSSPKEQSRLPILYSESALQTIQKECKHKIKELKEYQDIQSNLYFFA